MESIIETQTKKEKKWNYQKEGEWENGSQITSQNT